VNRGIGIWGLFSAIAICHGDLTIVVFRHEAPTTKIKSLNNPPAPGMPNDNPGHDGDNGRKDDNERSKKWRGMGY
jgi:hypothetical protein